MAKKPKPLVLTKSQTRHLRMVDRGEITIASNWETMEISFIDWMDNCCVNKKVLMTLLRRQLVRYSYDKLRMTTTKLGEKLASLAKAREAWFDKPGVIVAKLPEAMEGISEKVRQNQYKKKIISSWKSQRPMTP